MPFLLLHPRAPLDFLHPSIHWSTVGGVLLLGALYWWRAGNVPQAATPSAIRRASFIAGLATTLATLNGPLHDLSDFYLFSAHMVQHLLLTLLVPPLLIFGVTGEMLRPILRVRALATTARFLTRAPIAFALFNIVIAFWHLPVAYNTAMANHDIHIVQHLMFMSTAVIMWWPLMSPLPELPRISYPGQMLYCFLMVIPMSVVAIYVALADVVLYPAYESAPRIWNLTPLMDQHIGGLIMWVPGGLFFYVIMTVVFFRWARRGEDSRAAAQPGWRSPVLPPEDIAAPPIS